MAILYTIRLPWPPSVNKQYVNRAAKVKDGPKAGKKYTARMRSVESRAYTQHVMVLVRKGHKGPPMLDGRLEVVCLARPPALIRVRDLDNLWKIMLDSLRKAGVFTDDSLIDDQRMVRGNASEDGEMVLWFRRFAPHRALRLERVAGIPRDLLGGL